MLDRKACGLGSSQRDVTVTDFRWQSRSIRTCLHDVSHIYREALDRLAAQRPDVGFALQSMALRYASQRLHHLQLLGYVPSV